MKERGEATEVVGVTIGGEEADEQVRAAMAMGVDRVTRVNDERPLDSAAVSRILQAFVEREGADLVLMGKQAIDDDSNQAGQMLAGRLGWPQATFVSEIVPDPAARSARCTRETDRGLEHLTVTLPAVVTADLRLNEPRYVSLPALMRVKRRPIEVLSAEELAPGVEPRTRVLRTAPAPRRSAGVRVESVEELVRLLTEEEKVL